MVSKLDLPKAQGPQIETRNNNNIQRATLTAHRTIQAKGEFREYHQWQW